MGKYNASMSYNLDRYYWWLKHMGLHETAEIVGTIEYLYQELGCL